MHQGILQVAKSASACSHLVTSFERSLNRHRDIDFFVQATMGTTIDGLPNETLLEIFSLILDDTVLFDGGFPSSPQPHRSFWEYSNAMYDSRKVKHEYQRLEELRETLSLVSRRWSMPAARSSDRLIQGNLAYPASRPWQTKRLYPGPYAIQCLFSKDPVVKVEMVRLFGSMLHVTHLTLPTERWTSEQHVLILLSYFPTLRHFHPSYGYPLDRTINIFPSIPNITLLCPGQPHPWIPWSRPFSKCCRSR